MPLGRHYHSTLFGMFSLFMGLRSLVFKSVSWRELSYTMSCRVRFGPVRIFQFVFCSLVFLGPTCGLIAVCPIECYNRAGVQAAVSYITSFSPFCLLLCTFLWYTVPLHAFEQFSCTLNLVVVCCELHFIVIEKCFVQYFALCQSGISFSWGYWCYH